MKQKMQKSTIAVAGATCLVIAGIVGSIVVVNKVEAQKRADVAGTYTCGYASSEETGESGITVSYDFNAEDGTFEELWNESTFATGTYEIKGDVMTIVSTPASEEDVDSQTSTFLIEDGYLLAEAYIMEGDIPSGDTFDAECTMEDSAGSVTTIHFSGDGTYTYSVSSATTDSSMSGTYKRDGNLITRTREDGTELPAYYVHDGKLASLCYEKEDSAE